MAKNKYSLSIDNSTIGGKSISILEARYLKTEIVNNLSRTSIKNKIVGVKYLSESSSGETMYNIVNEKLFDLDFDVKSNFIGLAHDLASSLTSEAKGLISYLREDFEDRYLFDLEDPCHCLNLVIKKSLEELPNDLTDFISDIHSHFSNSPQRVAILHQVQKGENLNPLSLCHFAKTRWLSLGSSLRRLLKIWDSLVKYIEQAKKDDKRNGSKYQSFLFLLQDEVFKMKIIFFSSVIDKISTRNVNFQNQSLEIQELQNQIKLCVLEIISLFIKTKHIPFDLKGVSPQMWEANNDILRDDNEFLDTIILELNPDLKGIRNIKEKTVQKEIFSFCQSYLNTS